MYPDQRMDDGDKSEREFAEENMDRTGQAGLEGAFDADPDPNPARRQLEQDARDAFGGSIDNSSDSQDR